MNQTQNKKEDLPLDLTDRVFLITDLCMYEKNKKDKTFHPHAIEVVDMETGQVRYIKSGSRVAFLGGEISVGRNQDDYNIQVEKPLKQTPKQ